MMFDEKMKNPIYSTLMDTLDPYGHYSEAQREEICDQYFATLRTKHGIEVPMIGDTFEIAR